jgi:hypothetical protein
METLSQIWSERAVMTEGGLERSDRGDFDNGGREKEPRPAGSL